jgi:hypothetical protein
MAPQEKKVFGYHTLFISILIGLLGFVIEFEFKDMKDTLREIPAIESRVKSLETDEANDKMDRIEDKASMEDLSKKIDLLFFKQQK